MEYVNLTGTGLKVSRVCLGTMTFGDQLNEKESILMLHNAIDRGVNFIDTADIYTKGQSETITGKGLKGIREEIVLASKVGGPSLSGLNGKGLSRKHILSSVEASLQRLDTDYLDVLYVHFPDNTTPLEETLQTMDMLVTSGKVRYTAMSNFAAWQMMDALAICDKRNWVAPVLTETVYNAITRGAESELVPFLKAKKISMAIYNPIAGGLLSGKHSKDAPVENTRFSDRGGYYKRYWNDESFAAMDELTTIAKENDMSLLELSLRWCISYDYVTSVIIGVSKMAHLDQNMALIDKGKLSEDILDKCDAVWAKLDGNRFSYHR